MAAGNAGSFFAATAAGAGAALWAERTVGGVATRGWGGGGATGSSGATTGAGAETGGASGGTTGRGTGRAIAVASGGGGGGGGGGHAGRLPGAVAWGYGAGANGIE